MKEKIDFMDAYEDNDEIREFVQEVIGEDKEVLVEYHFYSDGKHKVSIEGGLSILHIDAYTKRSDLKNQLKKIRDKLENITPEENKATYWVINKLDEWRETFRNEEIDEDGEDENLKGWKGITSLIDGLGNKRILTHKEHQEVLFHLWQHIEPKLEEYKHAENLRLQVYEENKND